MGATDNKFIDRETELALLIQSGFATNSCAFLGVSALRNYEMPVLTQLWGASKTKLLENSPMLSPYKTKCFELSRCCSSTSLRWHATPPSSLTR